jgi:trypsin
MSRRACNSWGRAVLTGLTFFNLTAWAITIQDATTAGYVTGNSAYTGVVKILFDDLDPGTAGQFICSGSAVAPNLILTAGHCIDDAQNWQVTFETALGTTTLGVTQADLHPNFAPRPAPFADLPIYDVGLLKLDGLVPMGADIYGIKTNLAGFTFGATQTDIVGYGLGGNPDVGFLGTGTRRHAVNTIDGVWALPSPAFDDLQWAMFMTFSDTPANPGEGLINGGDSGGPVFFNTGSGLQVMGVASFGNLPRPGLGGGGPYVNGVEYISGHANLVESVTGSWVTSYIAANAVPEPQHYFALALGLVCMFVFVRSARKRSAARP